MAACSWQSYFSAILLVFSCVFWTNDTWAREEVQEFSIEEALRSDAAQRRLPDTTVFFFGRQSYPKPRESFGTFKTQKREYAPDQSERDACFSAFIAAMAALGDRAELEGANAVVDIASVYDGNLVSSARDFTCGADDSAAGVALQGRVVTLPGGPEAAPEKPEPPRSVRPF